MGYKEIILKIINEKRKTKQTTQNRSQVIDESKALDLIRKKCEKSIHIINSHKIYRGLKSDAEYLYVDPSKHIRKSANTSNEYTLLFDNYINEKGKYPARSKSIICTESYDYAEGYGDVYVVVPFDNSSIGYSDSDDFWFAFDGIAEYGLEGLDNFNEMIKAILNVVYERSITYTYTTYDELKESLDNFKEQVNVMINKYGRNKLVNKIETGFKGYGLPYDNPNVSNMIKSLIDGKINIWKLIGKCLDPSGLSVVNVNNWKGATKESEVWTASPSIMISVDVYIDIYDQI
jgi:hypothetical protein